MYLETRESNQAKRAFATVACALVGLVVFGVGLADAQTVRGAVLEQGSDRPVVAATVSLIDEKGAIAATAITDTSGHFIVRLARPGKYWARAQRLGYVNALSPAIDLTENATVNVIIRMEIRGIPIDTLVVRQSPKGLEPGRNQFTRRCRTSEGICLNEARIRRSSALAQ